MRSFTLLELIIVVVIIGILVTFAMPAYRTTKERALDQEAIASLKLIQAAQRIYRMDVGYYANCATTACLNQANSLRLSIPVGGTSWDYQTRTSGCAQALRIGSDPARYWRSLTIDTEPAEGSAACP